MPKPRNNTIFALYCDNILNHSTNESIVKLITLMIKNNETITTNEGIVVTHQNFVEVRPYTINVAKFAIPS